jgi:MFS family permease
MLSTAVFMLTLAYSTVLPVIVVCMFLLGLAIDVYRPASNALVADLAPTAQRPRVFGLLFWAVNLGFAGGVLTGGLLADSDIRLLFWIPVTTASARGTASSVGMST